MANVVILPAELTINSIFEVAEEAKKVISNNSEIILDARNVETIDALGLQLIFSVEKTAGINNIKFQLINVREGLKKYTNLFQRYN